MTLGLRNNNPLNIRRGKTLWKGEILPLKGTGGSPFCRFASIEWGIRAAFCILKTYHAKYQATCVEAIIGRWAPQSENNTAEYINGVCRLTGFGGKENLCERDWPALVRAMAMIECGALLPTDVIDAGFALYKNSPPLTPPQGGENNNP